MLRNPLQYSIRFLLAVTVLVAAVVTVGMHYPVLGMLLALIFGGAVVGGLLTWGITVVQRLAIWENGESRVSPRSGDHSKDRPKEENSQ